MEITPDNHRQRCERNVESQNQLKGVLDFRELGKEEIAFPSKRLRRSLESRFQNWQDDLVELGPTQESWLRGEDHLPRGYELGGHRY